MLVFNTNIEFLYGFLLKNSIVAKPHGQLGFSAKITKKKSLQFEQKIHYACFVVYAFDHALL